MAVATQIMYYINTALDLYDYVDIVIGYFFALPQKYYVIYSFIQALQQVNTSLFEISDLARNVHDYNADVSLQSYPIGHYWIYIVQYCFRLV